MDESPETNRRARPTILLVEDNPDLRSATIDLLETLGYEVLAAHTGAQALAVVRREAVDLALVNAYPTEGNGLELVDELRLTKPTLPALLVSGFGDDLELRRRVLAGQVGFLPIPFSLESLEAKIKETLELKPKPSRETQAEPIPLPKPISAPRRATPTASSRAWLAAAAVVLAAGLAFQLAGRAPEMPALALDQTPRGHEIELLEPVGEIDGLPERLVWRPAPGAVVYRIVLAKIDETTVWQAETGDTSIVVPEHITVQLHPAVSYVWRVEGLAEDLSATGRSALVAFRSGPTGPV